jgi:hypothetical protein
LQGFVVALLDADEDAGWELLAPFFAFFYFLTFFLLGSKVAALLDVHGGAGWEFLELLISAPAAASSATRFDSSSLNLSALSTLSTPKARQRGGAVSTQRDPAYLLAVAYMPPPQLLLGGGLIAVATKERVCTPTCLLLLYADVC